MKFDLSTDHGVVGWLHLRQWINDVGIQINDLAPALTAILRHNLSDQNIDLHKEPLSFLLMLCDHLQEWGRPRVAPDPLASGILENLRFSDKPTYDKKIRMRQVLVKGLLHREDLKSEDVKEQTCCRCIYEKDKKNCKPGDDAARSHRCLRFKTAIDIKKGITFTLPHNEAREADFEPCISWLLFCRDLQSIGYDKEALSFPISIIFEHIPPHIWCSFIWKPMEMDIFEEYANTHSSATYLCEWIEAARSNKEEGIKYEADRAKGKELFTINLHELKKPLRRGLNDEHWKDFFRWKWEFLGQKYLKSNLGAWFPEQE